MSGGIDFTPENAPGAGGGQIGHFPAQRLTRLGDLLGDQGFGRADLPLALVPGRQLGLFDHLGAAAIRLGENLGRLLTRRLQRRLDFLA